MDYEKKYKEAIERAKIWQEHLYDVNDKDYADELNYIFPELKESEDERIRKDLLNHLNAGATNKTIIAHADDYKKWADWLKKQDEQKPEWSEEDKRIIDNLISQLGNLFARKLIKEETKDKYVNWLKSLKERCCPQNEDYHEGFKKGFAKAKAMNCHWKPSEEQLKALYDLIPVGEYLSEKEILLYSLYNKLKEL